MEIDLTRWSARRSDKGNCFAPVTSFLCGFHQTSLQDSCGTKQYEAWRFELPVFVISHPNRPQELPI